MDVFVALEAKDITAINATLTNTRGAVRNLVGLNRAVGEQRIDGELHERAAGLLKALIDEAPFALQNQRTAFVATATLVKLNSHRIKPTGNTDLLTIIDRLAAQTMTLDELVAEMEQRIEKSP